MRMLFALLLTWVCAPAFAGHGNDVMPAPNPWPPQFVLDPPGTGVSELDQTEFVWGANFVLETLSLPSAGTLTLTLSDLEWPMPLKSMDLWLTDFGDVSHYLEGSGSLSVAVSGPAEFVAAVFARSQYGFLGAGAFQLQASFAPVPLPAGVWLLLSGLAGFVIYTGNGKRHPIAA